MRQRFPKIPGVNFPRRRRRESTSWTTTSAVSIPTPTTEPAATPTLPEASTFSTGQKADSEPSLLTVRVRRKTQLKAMDFANQIKKFITLLRM